MPLLIVEKGPDRGQNIPYGPTPLIVGRGAKATFKLNDPSASREHFKIFLQGDSYYIEDMSSLNGTVVNGQALEGPVAIEDGTQINIGETSFTWSEVAQIENDPLINQKLAGYHIQKRLGRGGMGTVYLACQLSLQRNVAIKILNPQLGQDKNFIQQFIGEARACATLNHPNILQVYDVGGKDGHYYYSMEYASGGSIQRSIDGQKKLPVEEALTYMLNTACGLEYAERKKIVHRDIKPDNLMLSEDNVVKIGDLGLAKRLDQEQGKKDNLIYGTPHFIAPEQARNEAIDHRADMYSFGASFYRILSGQTPFQGQNIHQIIMKHVLEPPPPLISLDPSLPVDLCQVIAKMMEKDRDKRYASHGEIIQELERIQKRVQRKEQRQKAMFPDTKKREKTPETRPTGEVKKLSQTGAHRRMRRRSQKKYGMTVSVAVATGLLMLYLLWPTPTMPRGSRKGSPEESQEGRNNAERTDPLPQPPLEKRYQELKSSQFTAADPIPFIQGYQSIVREAQPESALAQNALRDLELLLENNLLAPCKGLAGEKKFYAAFQLLAKFEKEFVIPHLQEKTVECRSEIEKKCREELFQTEIAFHEQWEKRESQRIALKLDELRMLRALGSKDFDEELAEILDRWSEKIKPQVTPEKNPDDARPQPEKIPTDESLRECREVLDTTLRSFDYKKGVKELENLLGKSDSGEWQNIVRDLKSLDAFLSKIGGEMSARNYPLLPEAVRTEYLKKTSLSGDVEVKPVGIENQRLISRISMAKGTAEFGLSLKELGPLWIYENLMTGQRQSGKSLVPAALFCYYYKLYRQGWSCCQKAKEAGVADKDLPILQAKFEQVEIRAEQKYKEGMAKNYRELLERQDELRAKAQEGKDIKAAKSEFLENVRQFEQALKEYEEEYRYTRFFSTIKE